ncbi:MAG: DUF5103 domain-containing protein [Bacteroidales bacterium]|nr:DUF5103 domain-containing protein [Bacteroidales bacterium]MCF8389741.1 DUF5103 domain-containing protein [Bacteroidales bacterium]
MPKIRKSFITALLVVFYAFVLNAQESLNKDVLTTQIHQDNIKSVMMFREGWRLSYPITELGSNVNLKLIFDDLNDEVKSYHYKIIHCDADWTQSELSEFEYLEGSSFQNYIQDYNFSFNTFTSYIHYELELPNEDLFFKVSGNYIIQIFEDYNADKLVLSHRFMITEKQVMVNADVIKPVLSVFRDNSQQINVSVNYSSFPLDDPYQDIKLVVLQNGRWDNAIRDLKPLFDQNKLLDYSYQMQNVFKGGNEFRWFDIKSLRYQSPYIKSVDFEDNTHHVHLFPEEDRSRKQYFYEEDLNGKYYIEIQEEQNNDTDADYVTVYFEFPSEEPLFEGDFYVLGGLCNWEFSEKNKMIYDESSQSYKLQLVLKQGYYNYLICSALTPDSPGEFNFSEGNHYETENDYIVLVYYKDKRRYYDRLIGYQMVNSLRK